MAKEKGNRTRKQPKEDERFERTFDISARKADEATRSIELAFSSEYEVERWFGNEILDHSKNAIRLDRLRDGGPVLVEHYRGDHVGAVIEASVDDDRKARATIRFGRGARANEIFQDVMDGIRSKISVGYRVHKWEIDEDEELWRATDWEPFEISIVSVPADPTVGVGRSADDSKTDARNDRSTTMEPDDKDKGKQLATGNEPVNVEQITNQVREKELKRINDLEALGKRYKDFDGEEIARECTSKGLQIGDFQARVMDKLGARKAPSAEIGLTPAEIRKFSFVRAMYALAEPNNAHAQQAAAFEREVSTAAAKTLGRAVRGILVPYEVMTRDLSVGTATAGGHTVATDLLAGSFIDVLRNRLAIMQVGSTMLAGLNGNVAIPRQTGGATAYWVAEAGAPTESQQAFDQVTLTPRTVGAFTDYGRKLLLQSSIDVENFVRNDLALVLALAIDLAAINGSGASNQPTGILNVSGIGDVAGGTNGLAPTWAHIVDLESDVAVANADIGSLAYLTNAKVRGKLKTTEKAANTAQFVFGDGANPLNGYKCGMSNQVPSNLTKGTSSGVCSAILFGNFVDLLIGMWGGLDITVDPYTSSSTGTVRIVVLQDVDIAVRHPESFSAMKDALTA